MICKRYCSPGIVLLAIPVLRVANAEPQQATSAQLPWWLWLIFVVLALIAIFWWQLFLRPSEMKEVEELEHHLMQSHENHAIDGQHTLHTHIEMVKPASETAAEPATPVTGAATTDSESGHEEEVEADH